MIIMENLETIYTGVLKTNKGYNAHHNYRVNLGNYLTEQEASQAVYNYIIDNITECEIQILKQLLIFLLLL